MELAAQLTLNEDSFKRMQVGVSQMLYAYADQNFLSSCAENRVWGDAVISARKSHKAVLVLSPMHFFEIGRANAETRAKILSFTEEVSPAWTYTQSDMQKRECLHIWEWFWGKKSSLFQPICSLPEATAAMHNVHPDRLAEYTLKDWVSSFVAEPTDTQGWMALRVSMDEQKKASEINQRRYRAGYMTKSLLKQLERAHVAVQLARAEVDKESADVYRRAEQLLRTNPIAAQIEFFIDSQGMTYLKSFQIESALTETIWSGEAKLDRRRQLDRQHATVALPFCDRFVSDDRDLIRRCEVTKRVIKFPTAMVQKGADFIQSLL